MKRRSRKVAVKQKRRLVARRNRRRGKANQSRMAKMLGVRNVGSVMGADGLGGRFACEFKSRVKSEVHQFMEQAISNCPPNRIPLVMLHLMGTRTENDLIMFRYKDWKSICSPDLYCAPRPTVKREPVKIKRRKKNGTTK